MNGLALAAALALAQAPAAEEPAPGAAERTAPAAAPEVRAAPSPRPSPPADAGGEGGKGATSTSTPKPAATAAPSPRPSPPAGAGGEGGIRANPPAIPPRPLPDREDAERAARAFLEALARGDATALAQASSERFSFDGDVLSGREVIRRSWRDLLAARAPAAPAALGALEVLQATEAAARYGKPPARLAPLVRSGVMIAIGDVGGRTVVLFVARENGRMAVLGMHD